MGEDQVEVQGESRDKTQDGGAVAPRRRRGWRQRLAAILHGSGGGGRPQPAPRHVVDPDLVPLLTELGVGLLDAGQATNEVEDALRQISRTRGEAEVRAFVVPTGVMVQVDEPDDVRTYYESSTGSGFHLDQVGALDTLVDDVAQARVSLRDARARLAEIAAAPARFGPVVAVLGHVLLSVGFALLQQPTAGSVAGVAALGLVVGVLQVSVPRGSAIANALPVLASFLVTVLAIGVVGPLVDAGLVDLVAPPLVSLLPGAALTTATMELTHHQVVSGASRLVYGLGQLLLLAFGVVAGVAAVGTPDPVAGSPLPAWVAYVGVALVAGGDVLFSSAPRWSLGWIALTLYAAFVAQAAGAVLLSPQLSGFLGGFVLVVVARLVARAPTGPSRLVTTLPGFWLLVPGSLGFIGISEVATSGAQAVTELVDMVLALFAIALGIMTGTAVSRQASTLTRTLYRHAPDLRNDRRRS
ncbi:threonine/serine exporter ThrE family protein [Isoptericola sp. NPDC057559]|uniref:threonine/serine ThrE exporter family protein n=1 Tax=Isoptericola sp. NPDC057559 TaxID=3346168 RepID=UPI0036CC3AB9